MYEETVERIARMMAEDNGDPQHWGVYATRAMGIVALVEDAFTMERVMARSADTSVNLSSSDEH
jgi:hypothetical protein